MECLSTTTKPFANSFNNNLMPKYVSDCVDEVLGHALG